jgi:murein tripeptide amidase MpaA
VNARLADPRGFKTAKDADDALREGKTIVLITSGIHSNEVGGHFTPALLAYRLATDTSATTRTILDNVILWLVPSLNPDGVTIVTRWYNRTIGTAAEGTDPPELYHHYAGHDNNRDWYAFTHRSCTMSTSRILTAPGCSCRRTSIRSSPTSIRCSWTA